MSDFNKIPAHIAVIMDGNGRWAKSRYLPRVIGHRKGVKNVKLVCDLCLKYNIQYLTLYAFSTENWKRPEKEIKALMSIFREFLKKEALNLIKKNIRLVVSGRYKEFPEDIVESIEELMENSKRNDSLVLNVALNYGGRIDIVDSVNAALRSGISKIDENIIRKNLYNSFIPDPDLLIRTSDEKRISNFLIWQSAYSELYFSKCLWPDFNEDEFKEALMSYSLRERRYGGVK